MGQYLIGDIEELTGIKAHVLRYWEEVIPSIAPKKDLGGRRIYSQRNLETILRLKYLIYEKKFTIEGARDNLISELDTRNENAGILQAIQETRSELTDLYLTVRKYRKPKQDA